MKPPAWRYDKTQARRQAKRRAQFNRMREALRRIEDTATLDEAKAVAREGLSDPSDVEYRED